MKLLALLFTVLFLSSSSTVQEGSTTPSHHNHHDGIVDTNPGHNSIGGSNGDDLSEGMEIPGLD